MWGKGHSSEMGMGGGVKRVTGKRVNTWDSLHGDNGYST